MFHSNFCLHPFHLRISESLQITPIHLHTRTIVIQFRTHLNQVWIYLVAQLIKTLHPMQGIQVQSLDWEKPLENGMAIHSNILDGRTLRMEESGRLQFMGSKDLDSIKWLTLSELIKTTSFDLLTFTKISFPKVLYIYSSAHKFWRSHYSTEYMSSLSYQQN